MQRVETLKLHMFLCSNYPLSEVDFSGVDFTGETLNFRSFWNCLFVNSRLESVSMEETVFNNCDLYGTILDPNKTFDPPSIHALNVAGLNLFNGKVYGYRTLKSRHFGSTEYVPRDEPYKAPYFSTDKETACHPGIYLAGIKYLNYEYGDGFYARVYCLHNEMIQAADKFRCKRLWVTKIVDSDGRRCK